MKTYFINISSFYKTIKTFLIVFLLLGYHIINAQQIKVIDNKGTIRNVNNNNVFTQNTDPNPSVTNIIAVENDIWFDTSTTPSTFRVWDGTQWLNMSATSSGWLINGNNGTDPNLNFLGTIDDVRMQIRSFDIPILEFGRRATLNLTQNFPDYTDDNQSLVHVLGNGGVSALQFLADGASFYKPMFFTTPNGSFRLKGSSGGSDLFEIGSAGPGNDGRLEFIVGDDGNEPIVFKRFHYNNTSAITDDFYREFFRVQGANNSPGAKTRFGININQNNYLVNANINAPSNGGGVPKIIANSTFQVEGSVSKSIRQINSNFTLTEDEHTVVITANATINFPAANTCEGRIYVIKNISGGTINSSNYRNQANINTAIIANNSIIRIQSNGTEWIGVNNTASAATSNDWSITGNSGTNPTTNYIGTSDAQDVSIRTNNTEAIRINQANQNVGININNPTEKLDVNGKLRIRNIDNVTTNTPILTTNANGVVEQKQLVDSQADNLISSGTNGGVYLNIATISPIKAMGKVNADGTTNKAPLNSTVQKLGVGRYQINLNATTGINDTDYVIQLTVRDSNGAGNDDYDISYNTQETGRFIVEIGDNDNGGTDRTPRDLEFMFTVLDYSIAGSGTGGTGSGLSSTGTPANGILSNPITVNDVPSNTFFQLQFNGPNPNTGNVNYQILLDNVPYSLSGLNLGSHTMQELDNGNGTYDYLFTSTAPLTNNAQYRQITGTKSTGAGNCNCATFYTIP